MFLFFSVKAHCCSREAQLDDSRITVLLEDPVIFTKFPLIYKAECPVIFFNNMFFEIIHCMSEQQQTVG